MCKSHDECCLGDVPGNPIFADGSWSNTDTQTCCLDPAVRAGLQLEWEKMGTFPGWWVDRQTQTNRWSILIWLCWCLFQAWQLPQFHSTFPSHCLLTHMKMALLSHLNVLNLKVHGCFFYLYQKFESSFCLFIAPPCLVADVFECARDYLQGLGSFVFNGIKRWVTNTALSLSCTKQWDKAWVWEQEAQSSNTFELL